jgi:transposase
MAPKFVAPYRMSGKHGKNDAADAAAICEAVTRPNMRFVPIKTIEQQSQLFIHRAQQGYVSERTALVNRMRGLLSELGIVLPQSHKAFKQGVHQVLEDLPGPCNQVIGDMLSELSRLEERIALNEKVILQFARQDEQARRLMQLRGVGPTTATAIVASVGNGHDFESGRQFSAWLGLVPRQHSSGGKARLGRITKAGDSYLRTLLVLGARAMLMTAQNKEDPVSRWALQLKERRGYWKAVVAIAAKNARMCWAALHLGDSFKVPA